jgi:hypothetical protein
MKQRERKETERKKRNRERNETERKKRNVDNFSYKFKLTAKVMT